MTGVRWTRERGKTDFMVVHNESSSSNSVHINFYLERDRYNKVD